MKVYLKNTVMNKYIRNILAGVITFWTKCRMTELKSTLRLNWLN